MYVKWILLAVCIGLILWPLLAGDGRNAKDKGESR